MIERIDKSLLNILKFKFAKDISFVFLSNIILGISGISINILITKLFTVEALGLFNLALSLYLLAHMFTLLGVTNSTIKFISEKSIDDNRSNSILTSAIIIVLLNSIVLLFLIWQFSYLIDRIYGKPELTEILKILILGLPVYAINKILISFFNGKRKMISYSIYSSLRYILILFGIFSLYFFEKNFHGCALAFVVSEFVLFILLFFHIKLYHKILLSEVTYWIPKHIKFGSQVFVSDFLIELNFRIDLLILGYYLNPFFVGIYSFASEIAKGLSQFATLIQINFNPIISKLWHEGKIKELNSYIRKIIKSTYLMYLPLVLLSMVVYFLFINNFMPKLAVGANYSCFIILLIGVFFFSGNQVILGLLTYTGHVKYQMLRVLYTLLINILGNLILIPFFGINGAALSSTIAMIGTGIMIRYFAKRKLNLKF